jgi:hypothetical protein
MAVPEILILQAWEKTGGQCECRRVSHGHTYARCTNRLVFENRGTGTSGAWAPRYITNPAKGTALACEILCRVSKIGFDFLIGAVSWRGFRRTEKRS